MANNITDYRFVLYERIGHPKLNNILEQINAHNHGSAGGVQLDLSEETGAIGEGHVTGYHIAHNTISGVHLVEGTITGRVLLWYVGGDIDLAEEEGEPALEVGARIYVPFGGTINKARAYLKSAPVGQNVLIDINVNGSSALGATKLTILDGENYGELTSFDSPTFATGDYFTMDLDQVGSDESGEGLTVSFEITTL